MEIKDEVEFCFPQLLNVSCRKPRLHLTKAFFLDTVLSIISIITVVLNLLVIIAVSHFRQLHSPTNIILLSLAVSDFLVGLLLLPLEIYRNTSCWFLGEIMCAVYYHLACCIPFVSIGNIVLISVDRYVAICHPLHYPTRITTVRVKTCVCLCWLWYGLYSILYIKDQIIHLIEPGDNVGCLGQCFIIFNYTIGVVDLILTFVLPVTAIVVLYMKVFVVAVIQARSMRSHVTFVSVQHPVKAKAKKSELKAARTLGILVVTYLSCFCPAFCSVLLEIDLFSAYMLFALFYFNSCVNPVIYTLFYPWFRKAIKIIITLQILKPDSRETNML
ncbi:trace amine-associated receptor 13c-like [Oryzias melastigma]|uniref:trace amine-associated receptor 13c-like n=1 Tax=Oryzias melastigma TaxID=30732 RepID=UPI000CF7F990|nr:trace amine-associated receptor 13c-like [Oryzias melastigma]